MRNLPSFLKDSGFHWFKWKIYVIFKLLAEDSVTEIAFW